MQLKKLLLNRPNNYLPNTVELAMCSHYWIDKPSVSSGHNIKCVR